MNTKIFGKGCLGGGYSVAGWLRWFFGLVILVSNLQAGAVEYSVTSTPGTGGLIFPSGTVKVPAGARPTFFVIPNDTYSVQDVKVNGSSVGAQSEVQIGPVNADQTLTATFVKSPSITASAGAGGTITPAGKLAVGYGGSRTFTITATAGYKVNSVTVNGVAVMLPDPKPATFTQTVNNIITASTISATFALDTTKAVITSSAGAGGTISPLGKTAVTKGSSQSFTIAASPNYRISSLKVDGKVVTTTSFYTFANVQAAHSIAAAFARLPVINAVQAAGGTITPVGTTVVSYGGSKSYSISPKTGYEILSLVVNGVTKPKSTFYSFSNVTAATNSITARFGVLSTYVLINATAGAGGTISPAGNNPYFKGSSPVFTITPAANYRILDVKVDGKSVGNGSSATITNVQKAHSIAATFIKLPVINAVQAAGGVITPTGSSVVPLGGGKVYTITPGTGYEIATLLVNGKSQPVAGMFTFSNVTAATSTITATFRVKSDFTYVTATTGANGTISPLGKTTVMKGESLTFNLTPAVHYRVLDVKVDGKTVGAVPAYTFTNAQVPHTIAASFTLASHPVIASSPPAGTITPSGTIQVLHLKDQSFTVHPPSGFKAGIRVDDTLVIQEPTGKNVTYVLRKVDRPHKVEAVYAPIGSQFAGTLGITLIGLGDTINVANASPAAFSILTNGTLGVASVFYHNQTARLWGHATAGTGPGEWTAKVGLVAGDNELWFAAVSLDGSASWFPTVVTYYPQADFTTPLTANVNTLVIGQATTITWKVGLLHATGAVVTLYQVAGDGSVFNGVPMNDNHTGLDEIQGDGIFTGSNSVTAAATGYLGFRVKVEKPGQPDYWSELKELWAPPVITDAQVDKAGTLADGAKATYDAAIGNGKTPQEAAADTAAALRLDPSIGTVGTTEEGGVWWVTVEGLLGVCGTLVEDQRAAGGGAGAAPPRDTTPPPVITQEQAKNPPQNPYYSIADLGTLFPDLGKNPLDAQGSETVPLSHIMAAAQPANRMKSDRALIISPFIVNLDSVGNSFRLGDDFFKPWPTIVAHKTCGLYADKAVTNNATRDVTLATFKDLAPYGYIHISTHGDNYFAGLAGLWQEEWGPNDFLKGNLSIVGIYSGLKLAVVAGKYVKTGYEDDLNAKRIAIGPGGLVVLLPKFFKDYLTTLPNSLVILAACRTGYNGSLMSVFLSKGAGTVIGFTDYVSCSYAQNTEQEIVDRMYDDKTVGDAMSSAVTKFGTNDADTDPAYLVYMGALDLKFPNSELSNGGFEDGVIDPWKRTGDGRVITALGGTRPTSGTFMGIISTGLGFTTSSGSLEQRLCVPETGGSLVFDWNFFSEEWLEYVGSQYQDAFNVSVAVIDPDTGVTGAFSTLFYQDVDGLAGGVTASDVGFDQGGVYNTGWRTSFLDLSTYKGKHVVVRFGCTDVGDSIYDSAILLDEITVLPVGGAAH